MWQTRVSVAPDSCGDHSSAFRGDIHGLKSERLVDRGGARSVMIDATWIGDSIGRGAV
jgi:Family of unknown function (DUF6188)